MQLTSAQVGSAIGVGGWIFIGFVLAKLALQQAPLPALSQLNRIEGTVAELREITRRSKGGLNYRLNVFLVGRGAVPYVLDDERVGGEAVYFALRDGLRRGDSLSLWVEEHTSYGNRLWQIERGPTRLLEYATVRGVEQLIRVVFYAIDVAYVLLTMVGFRVVRKQLPGAAERPQN